MRVVLALLMSRSCASVREYTKHLHFDCYEGAGGTPLDQNDTAHKNKTVLDCEGLCDGTPGCAAVTHDSWRSSGDCWLRSAVELDKCDKSRSYMHYYDTYTVSTSPTPVPTPTPPTPTPPSPPSSDFEAKLQQTVDDVVQHYKSEYPNLVLSLAWRDSLRDVAVASGKVNGRPVTRDDTFLYGSGTKPFTATGILRLIDSGKVKANDRAVTYLDPYMKSQNKPTMEYYFGESIRNATVLELIRMGTGIRDFEDDYDFDVWVLGNGTGVWWDYPYDAMSFAVSADNTKGAGPLYCAPGTCTAYSSTGFEVAGLLLAAVLNPKGAWYDLDLKSALFDQQNVFPTMSFPPKGKRSGAKISDDLTVPGYSVASTWPKTTIYDQDPSVLGWTCGNMVSSPRDVAQFFYHLLDSEVAHDDKESLISDASREEMINFETLSKGWSAGYLKYGAGLMDLHYGYGHGSSNKIAVQGHEGDTYGFLSSQGYVPSLTGSYSVASNVDNDSPMETMTCYLLKLAQQEISGSSALQCPSLEAVDMVV